MVLFDSKRWRVQFLPARYGKGCLLVGLGVSFLRVPEREVKGWRFSVLGVELQLVIGSLMVARVNPLDVDGPAVCHYDA